MLSITKVCNIPESIIIFIIFSIFLILKKKKQLFYLFTTFTALGTLLPFIIKPLIERIRPLSNLLLETDYSFPSGHATIATVFLISSIVIIAPLIKNSFSRKIFILCTSIIFPLVIISRVYLSVHWFSDVLAGILLGSICYILASFVCCLKKKNML
jgi:undecaprenyl-diphosphatase